MKFSAVSLAVSALCYLSATIATPVAPAEEARGYGGVTPPCANIRCAYGAPYYDRKTRGCLCPPINCPAVTLCLVGNEAYYDWKRRQCDCRPFATAH